MAAVFILTCITTLLCAVLLLRGYVRSRKRLLFWSGLCFAGLTIHYLFVIADLMLFPKVDFFTYRTGSAAVSMVLLIYGLIWESR
jgi:energy-converting hydrogenase Eha subunit G